MLATATTLVLATMTWIAAPPWTGTELVPEDVDLYVHVDDASGLRRELESTPLIDVFRTILVDEQVASRWATIAERLKLDEARCFDDLLGRDVVFAMKSGEPGEAGRPGADWLLATRMDESTFERVVTSLNGRHRGQGIVEFPCQGIVAAWRAPTLFIASSLSSRLFVEALERVEASRGSDGRRPVELAGDLPSKRGDARILGTNDAAATAVHTKGSDRTPTTNGARDRGPVLADHPLLRAAAAWPGSRMQLFVRHPSTFAGVSVITMNVADRGAQLRQRSRFANLPIAAAPDAALDDASLLRRFESMALLGVLRRQGESPATSLLATLLPDAKPCEEMRRNAGERWMLLIGDADGAPYVSCRVPAVAVAMEIREPCAGRRSHEAFLARAIQDVNARYAKNLGGMITPPEVAACTDIEAPRQCDLNRLIRALCGDHPMVRSSSLHWRTVAGDDGNWQLYASHRDWLDRVARRLEGSCLVSAGRKHAEVAVTEPAVKSDVVMQSAIVKAPEPPPPEGFLTGPSVATMLDGWGASADDFAAENPARFRKAVATLSSMLRGFEHVRWNLSRPEAQVIETQIQIDFARPKPEAP